MYARSIHFPKSKSFFLFGPRGTGKTTWIKKSFPTALYLDLLESRIYTELLADPQRLESYIPLHFCDWIILDEVQRVPALLHEVHRLIEKERFKFILTGSSARKLKKGNVNLLAGRAITSRLYPLTAYEIGGDFRLSHALQFGGLPSVWQEHHPDRYLESYVSTYLREEIQQESLTRNLSAFSRFLEAASFSQAGVLNVSEVARECAVHRKVVENYFSILEDLMIAYRLPVFFKRAKRRLVQHQKFYFFDVGVYRTIRPKGPLDIPEEIEGAAFETLVFQELRALNDYFRLGYDIFYWQTSSQLEIDFVLYGTRGLRAFEVKRASKIRPKHLDGMKAFLKDYPFAKAYILYGGTRILREGNIHILPIEVFLKKSLFYLR